MWFAWLVVVLVWTLTNTFLGGSFANYGHHLFQYLMLDHLWILMDLEHVFY